MHVLAHPSRGSTRPSDRSPLRGLLLLSCLSACTAAGCQLSTSSANPPRAAAGSTPSVVGTAPAHLQGALAWTFTDDPRARGRAHLSLALAHGGVAHPTATWRDDGTSTWSVSVPGFATARDAPCEDPWSHRARGRFSPPSGVVRAGRPLRTLDARSTGHVGGMENIPALHVGYPSFPTGARVLHGCGTPPLATAFAATPCQANVTVVDPEVDVSMSFDCTVAGLDDRARPAYRTWRVVGVVTGTLDRR